MASNPISKINENDEVIGATTIAEARENGWPRRVTRIFIFNEKGEFLLQKRSMDAKIHPGVWDCSGGHVDIGESYVEAGVREVKEELNIVVSIRDISSSIFFEGTFYVPCIAQISKDSKFTLKKDEVTEVEWVSIEELSQMIAMHPNNFTPWVVDIWQKFKYKLLQ